MTRLCDDPTREEMLAYLTLEFDDDEAFTDFDREEAVYWFAHDWHSGQDSNLYAALCSSPYTPSILASYIDSDTPAGVLYDALEYHYTTPALPKIA